MIINLIYDASVTGPGGPPAAFQQDIQAVASFFQGRLTDDLTLNLHVGFGNVHGNPLIPGNLGQSEFNLHEYSYTEFVSALTSSQTTADDFRAIGSLPPSEPFPGTHDFWVHDPLAAALGLLPVEPGTPIEGWMGFSNTAVFDYNRADGITAGQFDFIGVVAHEITEVLGRFMAVGEDVVNNDGTADYMPLDLFHYAAGERSFTRGGYFSIDGTRVLADFNRLATGDAGDWGGATTNDSYLAFSNSGVYNDITPWDLRVMDVLGFQGYPDDFGEDVNFAWNVSLAAPQSGAIELTGDSDWFRINLDAGVRYSVQLRGADSSGGSLPDPFLAVWDSASQQLVQDNDSGLGRDARLTFTPSTSGYYYIAASSLFGADTGNYTLRVDVAPKTLPDNRVLVDVVANQAVDHLPTFLGGNHAVGVRAAHAQKNAASGPATDQAIGTLLSLFDDGTSNHPMVDFVGHARGGAAHDWLFT